MWAGSTLSVGRRQSGIQTLQGSVDRNRGRSTMDLPHQGSQPGTASRETSQADGVVFPLDAHLSCGRSGEQEGALLCWLPAWGGWGYTPSQSPHQWAGPGVGHPTGWDRQGDEQLRSLGLRSRCHATSSLAPMRLSDLPGEQPGL